MMSAAVAATIALLTVATVIGAMVGPWSRRSTPLRAADAVGLILLGVVALDMVPDVVSDLNQVGLPWWPAVLLAVAGFIAAGRLTRWGCLCEVGQTTNRSTVAVALAIGLHRAVEGATLVATTSIPLAAAVIMHGTGEGYALGTATGDRRHRLLRLTVTCAAPLIGATTLTEVPLPAAVHPFLTAVIAGVLTQTAVAALRSGYWSHIGDRPSDHHRSENVWRERLGGLDIEARP